MLAEFTTINLADLETSKLNGSATEGSLKRSSLLSENSLEDQSIFSPEERSKRQKRFRKEWLSEDYFKDWLQPHPHDETYCICIACDIKLRSGKSELEKHATGIKHCKRVKAMKEDPHYKSRLIKAVPESHNSRSTGQILCEESGTFYDTSSGDLQPEGGFEDASINGNNQEQPVTISSSTLSNVLLKLSEFMESNSEVSKRRLEMAETEHQCRMQILHKELQLKTLEVQIRQAELQKLTTEQGRVLGIKKIIVNQNKSHKS